MDPCGVFRVMVDRDADTIVALHYASAEAKEPSCAIRGVDAEAVLAEVLRLGLVSRLDHAAYLGGELAKAEVALEDWAGLRSGCRFVWESIVPCFNM